MAKNINQRCLEMKKRIHRKAELIRIIETKKKYGDRKGLFMLKYELIKESLLTKINIILIND